VHGGEHIGMAMPQARHRRAARRVDVLLARVIPDVEALPARGDKLFHAGKEVGYVTSAVKSPVCGNIALSYVRREANQIGNELTLRTAAGESAVIIVELPFVK